MLTSQLWLGGILVPSQALQALGSSLGGTRDFTYVGRDEPLLFRGLPAGEVVIAIDAGNHVVFGPMSVMLPAASPIHAALP